MSSAKGVEQLLNGNGADITLPALKKKQAGPGPAPTAAAAAPTNPVNAGAANAAAPAPPAAALAAEPEAMEEDYAVAATLSLKPTAHIHAANAASVPAAVRAVSPQPTAGWPAYAAHPAADAAAAKPAGFATGRNPPSSKPTSRVQQRRARGRGTHQGTAATAAADLKWQPESLECVGESSDPTEPKGGSRAKQQRGAPGSSGHADAAATAGAAAVDHHEPDTFSDDAAAAEPPPVSVMAKATAAGARARQQQQQAGAGAQQPQWQQQQWQMRDNRISAGSSTTCNICASDSGGSSSSGSVTGPFAGRGGVEVESKVRQAHGAAAAAALESLGINHTAAAGVRGAAAAVQDTKGR